MTEVEPGQIWRFRNSERRVVVEATYSHSVDGVRCHLYGQADRIAECRSLSGRRTRMTTKRLRTRYELVGWARLGTKVDGCYLPASCEWCEEAGMHRFRVHGSPVHVFACNDEGHIGRAKALASDESETAAKRSVWHEVFRPRRKAAA